MDPLEAAKLRPLKEKKKPKANFLLTVFSFVHRLDKALNAIEAIYKTVKPYWTYVWETLKQFFGNF